MTTATIGTGTITLTAAVSGFLTFALAGVTDGQIITYGIRDGANSEVGTGTYTAAGTTLTRTVTKSTNADAAISLSGAAQVYITARREDIIQPPAGSVTDNTIVRWDGTNALAVQGSSPVINDTGDLNISSTTASTSATTGALIVAGGVGIGGDLYLGGGLTVTTAVVVNGSFNMGDALELGATRTSTGLALLDFHSVFPTTDKEARIIRQSGANGTWDFQQTGTGAMTFSGSDINIRSDTATPAGGSTSARLLFGTTAGFGIYYGSGAPTVSAASGSIYIRTDNAGANLRLYSNTTGSTTWAAITSA